MHADQTLPAGTSQTDSRPRLMAVIALCCACIVLVFACCVLGAGLVYAHVSLGSDLKATAAATNNRITAIESDQKSALVLKHARELEITRELVELRTTVEVQSRLIVDLMNEIRESHGKPATSFSKTVEDARQRLEEEDSR